MGIPIKIYKKIFISSIYTITLIIFSIAYGDTPSLFKEIVEESSRIKSIDADIIQYLSTPEHSKEVYKGRYRGIASGKLRIDYTIPSTQIVLNDNNNLYWYYPKDKILYQIGRRVNLSSRLKVNPLQEFINKNFDRRFRTRYLGKHIYGFFIIAHQFVIEDCETGSIIDLWFDAKKRVILAKIVKDRYGREIMKEIYGDYKKIRNIYFPTRVDVFARTASGITRNTTTYKNVRLNYKISDKIFNIKFPEDIKRRYLDY